MPSSEYTLGGGGALKLKGVGIDKKKKKKKPKPSDSSAETSTVTSTVTTTTDDPKHSHSADQRSQSASPDATPGRSLSPSAAEKEIREGGGRQKTEAEKRHDERRRKRLEDRLRREGVKTHKERVEELNKYLSGLSEHHDMPKIGPG